MNGLANKIHFVNVGELMADLVLPDSSQYAPLLALMQVLGL